MKDTVIFDNPSRGYWIRSINSLLKIKIAAKVITVKLGSDICLANFESIHIVLLSCYFQYLKNTNHLIRLEVLDEKLNDYLYGCLGIDKYFRDNTEIGHIESESSLYDYHNLWRVEEAHCYFYAKSLTDFLQKNWLNNIDFSAVNNAFLEVYQNIYDHSQSTIAFSDMTFDRDKNIIQFAACDLGLGIPTVLRSHDKKYKNDKEALIDSLEVGVTSKSQTHNKGFGLDNLVSILGREGVLRIASNKAFIFSKYKKEQLRMYDLDFSFNGTLIYMDIDVDCLPNLETELSSYKL